ncbi:MAG: NAD(P)H-hydrate dehydratase [Cyanobacteria bacterium P01_F01_bin.150]
MQDLKNKIQSQRRKEVIQQVVVTAEQMQAIESRIFNAGFPVAALMEKVAGRITEKICNLYPINHSSFKVGMLVGPGHNGGDALVVARELFLRGYEVLCYQPSKKFKPLTADHARYAASLGVRFLNGVETFAQCDLIVDGLFGFGLNRDLVGMIAHTVDSINAIAHQYEIPVVSIDLPSGIHSDTGAVLGTAIGATHTLCLGLWKQGLFQDDALLYTGKSELIDFDIPLADIETILGPTPLIQRITKKSALSFLPIPRPLTTHKYKEGHLLCICGSQRYMGAAILTGLAARASGVGLLSIAVPSGLKTAIATRIPDAITIGCPETASGAIAHLPEDVGFGEGLEKYDAIACGPGLSIEALHVIEKLLAQMMSSTIPLLLDADGLNGMAKLGIKQLKSRPGLTVLTPHLGEFKRLFPSIAPMTDRIKMAQSAAETSGAMVVLKGGRVAIAHPDGRAWINPESTPALARGGSGDVLTGLMGGLMAQATVRGLDITSMAATAVWWHAQAGRVAAQERTELGVDAETLAQYLIPMLQSTDYINDAD